jgi:hypothetical protein
LPAVAFGEGGLPPIASELRLASQFFQQVADTLIAMKAAMITKR